MTATQPSSSTTAPATDDVVTWHADTAHTATTFRVKERFGRKTVTGRIPVVESSITFDDNLPRGAVSLDVSAIDTGHTKRDKDLRGSRFFDAATFPLLDFRSTSTRRVPEGVVVDGVLTVRGEECPLTLIATLARQADGSIVVHASGVFARMTSPLRRAPRWLIGADVLVEVDSVLRRRGSDG